MLIRNHTEQEDVMETIHYEPMGKSRYRVASVRREPSSDECTLVVLGVEKVTLCRKLRSGKSIGEDGGGGITRCSGRGEGCICCSSSQPTMPAEWWKSAVASVIVIRSPTYSPRMLFSHLSARVVRGIKAKSW